MALYAMGDTHLSLGSNKPMDIFGGAWDGFMEKLTQGLSVLQPEDTLLIAGDVSWGMSLEESEADFAYLNAFPGTKILMKGNHDYWWNTAAKMERFFEEKGFTTLRILHNNCLWYADTALCGTRGWFYEEEKPGQSQKVFNRELMRLETSLKAAGEAEKLCFLHYPPFYTGYRCEPILELLERYQVRACYYGHLHAASHRLALQGRHGRVEYHMISADYLKFRPEKILE
ncbi:MAG: serine/threonine protein phosphatase [Ruminiclostridium sp.]|nr:serine/threonine protein phosphatase [Ruminiclostridium sp.]